MYTTRDVDIARLFPETLEILDALKDSDVKLAVASRSPTLDVAHTFLRKVGECFGLAARRRARYSEPQQS